MIGQSLGVLRRWGRELGSIRNMPLDLVSSCGLGRKFLYMKTLASLVVNTIRGPDGFYVPRSLTRVAVTMVETGMDWMIWNPDSGPRGNRGMAQRSIHMVPTARSAHLAGWFME